VRAPGSRVRIFGWNERALFQKGFGIGCALQHKVTNKTRLFTLILGATALAGLTYGVARRGSQRRPLQPLASQARSSSKLTRTPRMQRTRASTPDALDIAMSLDGIFDGQSEDGRAPTVRPHVRVPAPFGGDDEEAPGADDLGLAWLMQATQTENSLTESDLTLEIENMALSEDPDSEVEAEGQDEHEDFRRTLA